MSGSGKSSAIDYLTEHAVPRVYFGGIIYKAMEEAGIERTPDSERIFREEIREKEGKDFVVRQALVDIRKLIEAGQRRIVLDGLYTWTEYKILKKEFPTELTVIAVVAPKALRRKRLAERPRRPFNAQEATERDYSEVEKLEKGGPIALADYYIYNNKDMAHFHAQFAEILNEIGFLAK
ncbi:AAA family ATPase [Candidatus Saccharibacteria bacterium]|nr:AAA family ATPase [Candidatus Saccharibacteria bacterium]